MHCYAVDLHTYIYMETETTKLQYTYREIVHIETNSGTNPTVFLQRCLSFLSAIQCCGARTGTAGTVTFCRSGTGTGTGMHYDSGSGSNIKCNKKVKKS
jgi:hypothetical protein